MINLVSSRYAEAFFYLSEDVAKTDQYYDQLNNICKLIMENDQLFNTLRSPFVGEKDKIVIVDKLLADKIDKDVINFIKILIEKKRIASIEEITQKVKILIDEKNQIIVGEVVSAISLKEDTIRLLEEKLSKKYYKTVKLKNTIDKSILGGLIVNIENEQIDGSVKSRLEKIGENMSVFV